MKIERWCICEMLPDGRPTVADHTVVWGKRRELPSARLLVRAQFEADGPELEAAQLDPRIEVLPSLTAPAGRLSARMQARLATLGITPSADDTVLNVLRALRDRYQLGLKIDLER